MFYFRIELKIIPRHLDSVKLVCLETIFLKLELSLFKAPEIIKNPINVKLMGFFITN